MLTPVHPRWSAGAVFVCKKCEGNDRFDLRQDLKRALKEADLGKRMKVVRAGCLGLCPKERTSVVVAPFDAPATCHVVAEGGEERALLDSVVAVARRSTG